jgi:hypothetical protein
VDEDDIEAEIDDWVDEVNRLLRSTPAWMLGVTRDDLEAMYYVGMTAEDVAEEILGG